MALGTFRRLAGVVVLLLAGARARADDVAARVNGTPISNTMVREVLRSAIRAERTPPSSEEIAKLDEAALESLIDLELLYQEAQARGVKVSDAEVTAEIDRTRAKFSDANQYQAALAQGGMTEASLRADTRKTLAVNRLLTTVVWTDIHISSEEAQRFYADNRAAFVRNGKQLSYAEAEPSIMQVLREDAQRKRQAAFVAELRQKARIERPTPGID